MVIDHGTYQVIVVHHRHGTVVLLAGLGLGQSNTGVFRVGEAAAGHNLMRETMVRPKHRIFGGKTTLVNGRSAPACSVR